MDGWMDDIAYSTQSEFKVHSTTKRYVTQTTKYRLLNVTESYSAAQRCHAMPTDRYNVNTCFNANVGPWLLVSQYTPPTPTRRNVKLSRVGVGGVNRA